MDVTKKTLKIALFVSLASLVKFDFLVDGFIVALSVLVMAIFIYCYDDLSVIYITFCSALFSPLFRLLTLVKSMGDFHTAVEYAIPDMAFFVAYGIIYTLIYKYIVRAEKSINNFPFVIFFCDVGANIVEILARSAVQNEFLVNTDIIGALMVIGMLRVILTQIILIAMKRHAEILIDEEHSKEYRRLLEQASLFESEMHLMEKNASEIEDIMVDAYSLYKKMRKEQVPDELKEKTLEIAKNAHEVKGVYINVINTMKDTFTEDIKDSRLSFNDLAMIEKASLLSLIKKEKLQIDVVFDIRCDFYIESYFKMMSIIRNLLLNSVEAVKKDQQGRITLRLTEDEKSYVITIHDNGSGIKEEDIETIFMDGYSSKFNSETGNIQRGIGLTIVKDYVENFFKGKIEVQSRENVYTKFTITLPKEIFVKV